MSAGKGTYGSKRGRPPAKKIATPAKKKTPTPKKPVAKKTVLPATSKRVARKNARLTKRISKATKKGNSKRAKKLSTRKLVNTLTNTTRSKRRIRKAVATGKKLANSKTGKIVGGAIKLAKNIRNLDYKGAAKTVVNTYREAKKAKKVINYRRKKKK